jgi:KTSC domain
VPLPYFPSLPNLNSVAVESSAIARMAYDSEQESLHVEFRDGRAYRYEGVPARLYQGLLESDSKGTYFNGHIRNHFCCRIIQGLY